MAVRIPQPGRQTSQLIAVWESRPWWVPRLQHRFAGSDIAVRSFHATQELIDTSLGVVIFDASDNAEGAVQGVAEARQRNDVPFVIVVIPQSLQSVEWRLRDCGADAVVKDDIGGDELARICRRALRTAADNGSRNSSESV